MLLLAFDKLSIRQLQLRQLYAMLLDDVVGNELLDLCIRQEDVAKFLVKALLTNRLDSALLPCFISPWDIKPVKAERLPAI